MMKKATWLLVLSLGITPTLAYSQGSELTTTSHSIIKLYSPMIGYIVRNTPQVSKDAKIISGNIDSHLEHLLTERFTIEELKQIEAYLIKMGSAHLLALTQTMLKGLQELYADPCDKNLKVQLSLSPSYNALLEKALHEKDTQEKMKNFYLQRCKDANPIKNMGIQAKAENFAENGQNYIKNTLAQQFTEEQYATYYNFENSDLSKKFHNCLLESMMMSLPEDNKPY